jgi:hypothetical protein
MNELLDLLIQYAKLQKGYEDMAENAKRMEQWQFYDEHIASALEQKQKVEEIKQEILKLVPKKIYI